MLKRLLRNIVEDATWKRNPVRFVVVDLSLVVGVDMSAAEAFVRVQRLLAAKGVVVVFCGVTADSPCGKALSSVGILQEPSVEVFEMLNDAMECEFYPFMLQICVDVVCRDRKCISASVV
jgi:SulP family sulfate permease